MKNKLVEVMTYEFSYFDKFYKIYSQLSSLIRKLTSLSEKILRTIMVYGIPMEKQLPNKDPLRPKPSIIFLNKVKPVQTILNQISINISYSEWYFGNFQCSDRIPWESTDQLSICPCFLHFTGMQSLFEICCCRMQHKSMQQVLNKGPLTFICVVCNYGSI